MSDLLEDIETVTVADLSRPVVVVPMSDDDLAALHQISVLLKVPIYEAVVQLIRNATPLPNGHGYEVLCSGCGLKFQSARRPMPNKKHWCENCRKTGEPAADRARRYRDRKSAKEATT